MANRSPEYSGPQRFPVVGAEVGHAVAAVAAVSSCGSERPELEDVGDRLERRGRDGDFLLPPEMSFPEEQERQSVAFVDDHAFQPTAVTVGRSDAVAG